MSEIFENVCVALKTEVFSIFFSKSRTIINAEENNKEENGFEYTKKSFYKMNLRKWIKKEENKNNIFNNDLIYFKKCKK